MAAVPGERDDLARIVSDRGMTLPELGQLAPDKDVAAKKRIRSPNLGCCHSHLGQLT